MSLKKKNVLIYPCNSDVALELYESLRYSLHINVLGASSKRSIADEIMPNIIHHLPNIFEDDFINELNSFIDTHNVDMIFSTHDDVIYYFAELQDKINAIVIGGDKFTNSIVRYKSKTYELFNDFRFKPKVYRNIDEITDYPIFIKPNVGHGSVGARLVKSSQEISSNIWETQVVTEYLPGSEYTVDCYSNYKNELLYAFPRERGLIKNGVSQYNYEPESEVIQKIYVIAQEINSILKFKGLWFFQLKEDINGELKLLEICTRAATTMSFARFKGVNLPLLTVFAYLNWDVDINIINKNIELYRYSSTKVKYKFTYKHVYLDYDDTLIINDKVNLAAITFIYQCLNKEIDIYLITKHQYDLKESLKRFNISENLFEKIIWIPMDHSKYKYINEVESIFIDNHFQERKEVYTNCNIPVFDVEGIKSLIRD